MNSSAFYELGIVLSGACITKILEGSCTRHISNQWQLDVAIKELK